MLPYRREIDGLRAIAVTSVICFHFGIIRNGYLGVDVFFVISGYLITQTIYFPSSHSRFSLKDFYIRRIRRIMPLLLVVGAFSLALGYFVMLPDDLENLSESVVATNLFGNNVLLLNTIRNYWDPINHFKPLMHTWSLGIEEQFYLLYPLLFLPHAKQKSRITLFLLIFLSVTSLVLFLSSNSEANKFYLIQYRFFELAVGGLAAILLTHIQGSAITKVSALSCLLYLLLFDIFLAPDIQLIIICLLTVVLTLPAEENRLLNFLLQNRLIVFIGKISFSLYLWHQVMLAYGRYFVWQHIESQQLLVIFILIMLFSIASYYLIEKPFRNKNITSTGRLLSLVISLFIISTTVALYLYKKKGIVRDVPELELASGQSINGNVHASYNDRIYHYDKSFVDSGKNKVLVLGNSFARDWANVLLESNHGRDYDLSYLSDYTNVERHKNLTDRVKEADIIFVSRQTKDYLDPNLDTNKLYCIGPKNFGTNMGFYYNKRHSENYCTLRCDLDKEVIAENALLKEMWTSKYVDIIENLSDAEYTLPVFTPECKFISQDSRHLTPAGARYLAVLVHERLDSIFHHNN